MWGPLTPWGGSGGAGPAAAAGAGGAAGVQQAQSQQQLEQARKEVLDRVEDKMRREEIKDAERHRGRSRYYGGGYDNGSGVGGSGDCGRPYYVQPWKDRAFGSPLEYRAIRPLPQAIVRAYAQLQSMSFQGLWPEIHRAWMTVDNVLYLWDYHTENNTTAIDELDQLIVAVGLVRPKSDVFKDEIKYLVVVCTPTAVELFALWFLDGNPESGLQIRRTSFRVSTDGVIVRKVVGTPDGRIFLAGQDGNVYEVFYEHEGASLAQALGLANKCRKINRTQTASYLTGPMAYLQGLMGWDSSELVDLAVDDARGLLYSLSASSVIQLYDLGERGEATKLLVQKEDVFRKAELLCKARGMHVEEKHLQKGHGFRIVSIHVVPTTESDLRHLVAVSNAGFRFYFTTTLGPSVRGVPPRPDRLELIDIRYPPKPGVWDALRAGGPRESEAREKYEPGFVPNNSPLSYYQAHYANGVLVLADGTEEQAVDAVVAFCDEGSADRGGEVVCEVLAPGADGGLGLGKIRAMAEEPYAVFPVPDNDRDRALDQLRYLVATSASPTADERRSAPLLPSSNDTTKQQQPASTSTNNNINNTSGGGSSGSKGRGSYAGEFAAMFEVAGGAAAPQLATRFGAALKEAAQPLTSSRLFVFLTSTGLHVVGKLRPVDVVLRLLQDRASGASAESTRLGLCDGIYGPEELCALLYQLAAQMPLDAGYPVGRQLLATPLPASQTAAVAERAAQYIRAWYARPSAPAPTNAAAINNGYPAGGYGANAAALGGGGGGQLTTTTHGLPTGPAPGSTAPSTQYEGLLLTFARLVRAVWYKPVAYMAKGQLTLLLRPPEIQAITAPLRRLKTVVTTLYPAAVRAPPAAAAASPFVSPASGLAMLSPAVTGPGAPTAADGAYHEHQQVYALFRLMDRTLQALELLAQLAVYWEESNRVRLPLDRLRDVAFVDLVSAAPAQDAVKATMGLLLQPGRTDAMSDRLTRGLSERAFSFFSQGDQLTYEGRRYLAQAASHPIDSAERAAALAQAAVALVRAAAYWRGPADVDALDGGLDRNAGTPRGRGLAHDLLALAPTQPEVLDAVVDMALTAAANFGARPYTAHHMEKGGGRTALVTRRSGGGGAGGVPFLDAEDPARAVAGPLRAELKQRCFLAVRDAARWLLDPRARGSDPHSGVGLPQELLERAAWRVLLRCIRGSEDEELHFLLYAALLQERGPTQREMLLSVQSPHIERFLDRQPERLELLKQYYQHNDRQAEAMELLEAAALTPSEEVKLPERVNHLREAIQCATLAQGQGGGGGAGQGAVSAQKVQALQDQLDVAQLQLKVLTRLKGVIARAHGGGAGPQQLSEQEERHLTMLDRGFLPSTQLFALCNAYTLWEECLEIIAMCNTDQRDMGTRVESFWRFLVFNELPAQARSPELQAWLERKTRDVLSRWWSPGRADRALRGQYVGLGEGMVDDPQDMALRALLDRVTGLARAMHVERTSAGAHPQQRPAFPVRFLTSLLLELEAEVDAAQGRVAPLAAPASADPSGVFPHRTWRMLHAVGVGYMELFATHIEAYKEAHMQARSPRLKLHILDALRDLTTHWYAALRESTPHGAWGSALIDTRQQSAVVRELSKLANASNAGNLELNRILDELARLQECFQMYPDYIN